MWDDDDVLRLVGLEHLMEEEFTQNEWHEHFARQLEKLKQKPISRQKRFFRNLDRLSDLVGIAQAEQDILLLAILAQEEPGLAASLEACGELSIGRLLQELARILHLRFELLHKTLSPKSTLYTSGLLEMPRRSSQSITGWLEPLDGLGSALRGKGSDLDKVLSTYFYRAPEAQLSRHDYPHIEEDLTLLLPFLQNALDKHLKGVNLLLYGPPGTGKTELARLLAQEVDMELFEVSNEDQDGDAFDRGRRFRAFLLCQHLFSRRRDCLILFDEVEDVFSQDVQSFFGLRRKTGKNKGWTNRLLENNPIPTLWVSNDVEQMDPAFLRRFSLVMEVPVPPRQLRQRILNTIVKDLPVGSDCLGRLAANDFLAPAHLEQAVKVVKVARVKGQCQTENALQKIIASTHKAMGFPVQLASPSVVWQHYDPKFINADCNLVSLVQSLISHSGARICLYGPPGSGKTNFVYFLAQKLERTVTLKRASDILRPFVGQTEQNLAAMFSNIDRSKEILLLDEADSFLQDRTRANHSWEITQVNELLVQLENFEGLFFCATNLLDILDNAVFRRFDLKVKFDYMRPDQVWELFKACLIASRKPILPEDELTWRTKLEAIRHLTPGDFSAAKRRLTLIDNSLEPDRFIESLELEAAHKPDSAKRQIGFCR
jgi:SpoVK/Ycf46/Vps4 family AAA+-type ATPase